MRLPTCERFLLLTVRDGSRLKMGGVIVHGCKTGQPRSRRFSLFLLSTDRRIRSGCRRRKVQPLGLLGSGTRWTGDDLSTGGKERLTGFVEDGGDLCSELEFPNDPFHFLNPVFVGQPLLDLRLDGPKLG